MAVAAELLASAVVFGITSANSKSLSTLFSLSEEPTILNDNISNPILRKLDSTVRPVALRQKRLSATVRRIDFKTLEDLGTGVRLLQSRGYCALPVHEIESVPVHTPHDLFRPQSSGVREWSVYDIEGRMDESGLSAFYCSLPESLRGRVVVLSSQMNAETSNASFELLLYHLPYCCTSDDSKQDWDEEIKKVIEKQWVIKSTDSSFGCLIRLAKKSNGSGNLGEKIAVAVSERESLLFKAKHPHLYQPLELLGVYLKLREMKKNQLQYGSERELLIPEIEGEQPTRALDLVFSESKRWDPSVTLMYQRAQDVGSTEDLWDPPGPVESSLSFHHWSTLPPRNKDSVPFPAQERRRVTTALSSLGILDNLQQVAVAQSTQRPVTSHHMRWDELLRAKGKQGSKSLGPPSDVPSTNLFNMRVGLAGQTLPENVPYPVGSSQALGVMGSGSWREVLTRLEILVDTAPGGELPFLELGSLYFQRYLTPLNPLLFGYTDLKALIVAAPPLSLVWIYNTPPSKELFELRKLFKLESPSQFEDTLHTLPSSEASGDLRFSDGDLSGPVPLGLLRVRRRSLNVQSVSQDVVVALVAHWVLMHEAKVKEQRNPKLDEEFGDPENENEKQKTEKSKCDKTHRSGATETVSPNSAAPKDVLTPVVPYTSITSSHSSQDNIQKSLSIGNAISSSRCSTVGMSLSLLARTWDANWSNVCTLASLLERSGYGSLEDFVRTIPAFDLLQSPLAPPPPSGDVEYHESLTVVYLKRSARIPIVPELVPDPTVPSYDAPKQGETHLVFFPPLYVNHSLSTSLRSQKHVRAKAIPRYSSGGIHAPCSVKVKDEVRQMLFELITVCCEWQRLRWLDGEDLVELREQQVEAEDPKLKPSTRRESVVSISSSKTPLSSHGSSDEELEPGEEDVMAGERLENKRLQKKERRESKRRRRTILREWCRTRRGSQNDEAVTVEDAIKAGDEIAKLEHGTQDKTEEGEVKLTQAKKEANEVVTDILKGLEKIRDLEAERKEYRNRSVGIFVSSIKLEWNKYFENAFPLTYFMEQCGIKKLKSLLMEVPNFVLTGDGGFMRVATVDHAKALCNPFPPQGFDATGFHYCSSSLTESSTDPKYQTSTYICSLTTTELAKITTKSAFFKQFNMGNTTIHKRHSIGGTSEFLSKLQANSGHKAFVAGNSVSAVWELPVPKARSILATMLADLVVLHANKQKSDASEKATTFDKREPSQIETYTEGREPVVWEKQDLTANQGGIIEKLKALGVNGLKIHDIASRWNCSFVRFSPFSSFLKKAGFESMKDPEFQSLVKGLADRVLTATLDDGTAVLFPASVEILDDPTFRPPPDVSIGLWLKHKSLAYINQHSALEPAVPTRRASTSSCKEPSYSQHDSCGKREESRKRMAGIPPPPDQGRRVSLLGSAQQQRLSLSAPQVPAPPFLQFSAPPPPPPPPAGRQQPNDYARRTVSHHDTPDVSGNDLVGDMTRRLRSIEANMSDQTTALLNLSRLLSLAAKKSEQLPPELMRDISTLMSTLASNQNSTLPSAPSNDTTAISRRCSSNNVMF